MLTGISIHNFKCFTDAEISLSKLNLFVGANSSGKSSAIQALRLSLDNLGNPIGKEVQMVSKEKKMGRFHELRSFFTNQRTFVIKLSTDQGMVKTSFTFGDDAMLTTKETTESSPETLAIDLAETPIFYLPANRDSAKDVFPMNLEVGDSIGMNGEYVIDYYARHSSDILNDSLIFDKNLRTLEGQVNYWLFLLTGYTLKVTPDGETYTVRYKRNGRELRPYHVGTGVSFISTFLIVCLSMSKNGLVIIENPEIHLHPKAQAIAMDFFNAIAQAGIQMVIETHSDHLFNGIRRLIAQKKMEKEDASIYFFKLIESQESSPIYVELTDKGRMKKYERGLFDQFDDDLDILLQAK